MTAPARTWRASSAVVALAAVVALGVPAGADEGGVPPVVRGFGGTDAPEVLAASSGDGVVAGSFVVRTEEPLGPADRSRIAAEAGGTAGAVVSPDTFVVAVAGGDEAETAAALAASDDVAAVHPEVVYAAAEVEPNDPCWRGDRCVATNGSQNLGGQVELRNVGAAQAWEVTRGSTQVVVAVLDTKIETSPPHRDLVGKLLEGRSFVDDRACGVPGAARDHGTIAAGLIAARPDNGLDIAGLGWDTVVLPVEVLDDCGAGTTSAVAGGIRWAAARGADVINLSLTAARKDPTVSAAIADARAAGALVVAAAGNQGSTEEVWPAADLGVVGVAATGLPGTTGEDRLAPFSNRGHWVDIAAPGVDVIGLRRVGGSTNALDGTSRASGTSFAAPIVSAAAALVMAEHPELTPEQVVERLAESAVQIPGAGSEVLWGRLDAAGALLDTAPGYRMAAADGGLFSFGDAAFAGSAVGPAGGRVVGGAAHVSGRGYWLATDAGQVRAFGAAPDLARADPNRPEPRPGTVVGIAATPGGDGYWLATASGGVHAFGRAPGGGGATGAPPSWPVVGIAEVERGDGYWLVARDGGIFSYAGARFFGSTGAIALNKPIVGMAATPSGGGYWLVAADGGVFAFGDAAFHGSTGATALNEPIVGMAATDTGRGYWLVASDGGIFAFGDAAFLGSTGDIELNQPIVDLLLP